MAHLEGGFLGSTSPKMKPSLPYKHKMHENRLKTNEIQRQIKLIVIFFTTFFIYLRVSKYVRRTLMRISGSVSVEDMNSNINSLLRNYRMINHLPRNGRSKNERNYLVT